MRGFCLSGGEEKSEHKGSLSDLHRGKKRDIHSSKNMLGGESKTIFSSAFKSPQNPQQREASCGFQQNPKLDFVFPLKNTRRQSHLDL